MNVKFQPPIFRTNNLIRKGWINVYDRSAGGLQSPGALYLSRDDAAEAACGGATYRIHVIPKAVRA